MRNADCGPEGLAAANDVTPLAQEAARIWQAVWREGRRYRALNPFEDQNAQLLAAANRGG